MADLSTKFADASGFPGFSSAVRCVALLANDTYAAFGITTSPYTRTHAYNSTTGFGAAITGPVGPVSQIQKAIQVGNDVIFADSSGTNGTLKAYPFSGGVYGTRYTAPTGIVGTIIYELASLGTDIIYCNSAATSSPRATVFTPGTGWGTAYAAPSTLITWGYGMGLLGSKVLVTRSATPYWRLYNYVQGSGFGSSVTATGEVATTGPTLSVSGGAMVYGASSRPRAVAWTGSSFGSQYTDNSLASGQIYDVEFCPPGLDFVFARYMSTGVSVGSYKWTDAAGFGTLGSVVSQLLNKAVCAAVTADSASAVFGYDGASGVANVSAYALTNVDGLGGGGSTQQNNLRNIIASHTRSSFLLRG